MIRRLAGNAGAQFSETEMATMTRRAENNGGLAELLGRRLDVPLDLLRKLLMRATEAVRAKLLSCVNPERQAELRFVLAKISKSVQETISRDYTEAQRSVESMRRAGKLNEDAVLLFAISKRVEHVVVALSALSASPFELIDRLMCDDSIAPLLIPCKAAGLNWATVRAILKIKVDAQPFVETDFDHARNEYASLSISAAARILGPVDIQLNHASAAARCSMAANDVAVFS